MNVLRFIGKFIRPHEFLFLLAAAIVLAALYLPSASPRTASVEVKFADASGHGLAIVPASCPSDPHYSGDCYAQSSYGSGNYAEAAYVGPQTRSCTASTSCADSTTVHTITASCVVTNTPCAQYWTCNGGVCVPPPAASFVAFSAIDGNGVAFQANGHLLARPLLVALNETSQVYWNVKDAQSCSVTGTNGDTWTTASSGANGVKTSAITSQTTYTLHCNSYPGATPAYIEEQQTVNLVPSFHEL